MKTIEERAREYVPEPLNDHYVIPACIAIENKRQAYIIGATEQRAIDIEKACEWLRSRNVLTEASIEGFRKAMEE